MITSAVACPERTWLTTTRALLVLTAYPIGDEEVRKLVASPAVIIPITWPAELTSAPPESPGLMVASLWIMPFRVSEWPLPSLAVMVWSVAVTWPWVTVGAPPWPRALPIARTGSPTLTLDESARVTVGRPDTPSIWISATSEVGETPITCAVYVPLPETTTEMLIEPSTTWLLVSTSPDDVMIMPVPAAEPVPVVVWTTVLMSTIAGATLAVIVWTLMVPFWLADGVAAEMGAVELDGSVAFGSVAVWAACVDGWR